MTKPTVRAKFNCGAIVPNGSTSTVHLYAVYSSDPASENKAFCDATPSGVLSLSIQNDKPALAAFEPGKNYFLDFTPAD